MILFASAPGWLAALTLVLLLLAAIEDAWRLRISNWVSAGVAVGAFVAVAVDGPIVGLWQNILLFGAVLVGGDVIAAEMEEVVNLVVSGEETLCLAG